RDDAHARVRRKPGATGKQHRRGEARLHAKKSARRARLMRQGERTKLTPPSGGDAPRHLRKHETSHDRRLMPRASASRRLKSDGQAMGGRLMRSGPRPLRASARAGKTIEAGLYSPRLRPGSPAIATTENRLQQLATRDFSSSPDGGAAPSWSW